MAGLHLNRSVDPGLAAHYVAAGFWGTGGLRDGMERWAGTEPTRRALVDAAGKWTYAELEETVARGVSRLRQLDVGAGTGVLVVTPISAAGVATYLATIRTGAHVVLLDRRCGRADVAHATGPLDLDLVVSTPDLADHLGLADLGPAFVTFDDLLGGTEQDRFWVEPDPKVPAAVFFTSGTTNRPKAVIHSIDTLCSGAGNFAAAVAFTPDDTAFLSSPVASITGIMQVHLTLERGGTLVLEDRFEPAASLGRLIEHRATVLGGAPIIAEELFKQARRQDLDVLPLRAVSLGGAMIPRDLLELAVERWGIIPARVYGSSEAPVSTFTLPGDTGELRLSDDGALAPGTEIEIDATVGGEVLVRGPMLFLGYLHDEDNAAAFRDGGWLRTGDLGRLDGGRLTVTGRLKEVVARKGLKISLPEIDGISRGLPGVEEAVAYAVPDPETGERLALALYAHDGSDVDFEAVIQWLRDAGLATWKLPEEVAVWDAPLPRTSSGKVQRRKLTGGGARRMLAPRLRTLADGDTTG